MVHYLSFSPFFFQAALRGFLVILALSLHAVFEGIGLGLAQTSKSAWFLFFAISCHKYVISFCIGMQFINSGKFSAQTLRNYSFFLMQKFEKLKLSIKTTKVSIHRKIHWNPLRNTTEEKSFYCYSVNKKVLGSGSNKTVCTLYLPCKICIQPFLYRSRTFYKKVATQ